MPGSPSDTSPPTTLAGPARETAAAADDERQFTPEEHARLTQIWDALYELYLAQANGSRAGPQLDAEIAELIRQRDAIRSWGWSTGRNWRDDQKPRSK